MKPGQLTPNDLEVAILQRIAVTEPKVKRSVENLHVLSRTFTGVGSFTNFQCDGSDDDSWNKDIGLSANIQMPGVPLGMGAVLFCQDFQPKCLEIYTYQEYWDGAYDGFAIIESA